MSIRTVLIDDLIETARRFLGETIANDLAVVDTTTVNSVNNH